MKLTLNKKVLKNLSSDNQVLPEEITPQVGGGITAGCHTDGTKCEPTVACTGDGGGGGGNNSDACPTNTTCPGHNTARC